jgi:hypothetical protein
MSILITLPTTYNLAIGKNMITLSGMTQSGRLYLAQVLINGASASTIEAPPNPATVSHIDISRIVKANLYDDNVEKIAGFTNSNGAVLEYKIRYGEKIGGTQSFSATSSSRYVINGYKTETELLWNYDPYLPSSNTFDECLGGGNANVRIINTFFKSLTNYPHYDRLPNLPNTPMPSYVVYDNEYQTQTIINSISQSRTTLPADDFNKHPWAVRYTFFDEAGSTLGYNIKTINELNGAGPFTDSCTLGTFDTPERLVYIPSGPQNLKDWGVFYTQSAPASYRIGVWTRHNCRPGFTCSTGLTSSGLNELLLDEIYRFDFKIVSNCSPFKPVRFSFRNAYGVRDYITFNMRNTEVESIEREMFYKNVGTWDKATYTIPEMDRGHQVFATNVEKLYTAQSDFIDEDKSRWILELFRSPDVKVFFDGDFFPVVITSTSYEVKNYMRENLFRYTIEFRSAYKPQIQ